jgi:hypothetical protein
MLSPLLLSLALLGAATSGASAQPASGTPSAAPAGPAPGPAAPPQRGLRSEPAVQRSVVEDDNARIEELRVRGAVRSTVVKPKGAITKEYEVIPADAGRDISAGPNSAKGSAGQRVWRVLSF